MKKINYEELDKKGLLKAYNKNRILRKVDITALPIAFSSLIFSGIACITIIPAVFLKNKSFVIPATITMASTFIIGNTANLLTTLMPNYYNGELRDQLKSRYNINLPNRDVLLGNLEHEKVTYKLNKEDLKLHRKGHFFVTDLLGHTDVSMNKMDYDKIAIKNSKQAVKEAKNIYKQAKKDEKAILKNEFKKIKLEEKERA